MTLVPLLLLAPVAVARQPRALAIPSPRSQVAAIIVVGGDWMPYARLMVPVVPSLVYAAALVSRDAHPAATAPLGRCPRPRRGARRTRRHGGPTGRRGCAALVAAARPLLGSGGAAALRFAALDVGWVSAATEADIVDLGG